jgi:hypothetical protein
VTGGGAGGGQQQICTDYANAYVSRFVRCGSMTSQVGDFYRPFYAAQCNTNPFPPNVAIDSAGFQACLDRTNTASCATPSVNCTSDEIFNGTVGQGGSCFDDLECLDAFYCDESSTCPGTCTARIAVGQPVSSMQRCVKTAFAYNGTCLALVAAGQSCAPTGGSMLTRSCAPPNTCLPSELCGPEPLLGAANAPCTNNGTCALGLQCAGMVCVPLGMLNAACDSARSCQEGLSCSPANVCVDATPAPIGASCSTVAPVRSCVPDAFCNVPQGMMTGTCAALRTAGQSCTYGEQMCAMGLYCTATSTMTTGMCRAPGALNDPCTYPGFSACGSKLYCTATVNMMTGVCANQKGQGAVCAASVECLSYNCSAGMCTRPPCTP